MKSLFRIILFWAAMFTFCDDILASQRFSISDSCNAIVIYDSTGRRDIYVKSTLRVSYIVGTSVSLIRVDQSTIVASWNNTHGFNVDSMYHVIQGYMSYGCISIQCAGVTQGPVGPPGLSGLNIYTRDSSLTSSRTLTVPPSMFFMASYGAMLSGAGFVFGDLRPFGSSDSAFGIIAENEIFVSSNKAVNISAPLFNMTGGVGNITAGTGGMGISAVAPYTNTHTDMNVDTDYFSMRAGRVDATVIPRVYFDAHPTSKHITTGVFTSSGMWFDGIIHRFLFQYGIDSGAILSGADTITPILTCRDSLNRIPFAVFPTHIQIQDGHQAVGKILTSDASGNASWQTQGSCTCPIGAGMYLPVATDTVNIHNVSAYISTYTFIDSIVTVDGEVDFAADISIGLTRVSLSLPFPMVVYSTTHPTLSGQLTTSANSTSGAIYNGDGSTTPSGKANVQISTASTAISTYKFHFTYIKQ